MLKSRNYLKLCYIILWALLPLSAHAAFRITRSQPDLPPWAQEPFYGYATVSYGNGVYAVYEDFVYSDLNNVAYQQESVSRVSAQGQILDSIPLLITLKMGGWSAQLNNNASVSGPGFDGQRFLMVFQHRVSLADTLLYYGSRIGPSGPLLDSVGVHLTNNVGGQWNYALTYGDSLFLLVWCDGRKEGLLMYGARIRKDLTVLEPDGFRVDYSDPIPGGGDFATALAYNGRVFLAVWDWAPSNSNDRFLSAARVREDGVVVDTVPFRLTPGPVSRYRNTSAANVASDGQDFLVAFLYEDSLAGCQYVAAVRVSGSGVVLDTIPLRVSKECHLPSYVGLTYNGHDYQVLWSPLDNEYLRGARVSPNGVVKDTEDLMLFPSAPHSQTKPMAASDRNGQVLVAWVRSLSADPNIYGGFLDTTGREVGVVERQVPTQGQAIFASLSPPYPNPMRNQGEIAFSLPSSGKVSLSVYDALGRKVKELLDGRMEAGPHRLNWDARDENGFLLSSGVYFLRLEAGKISLARKLVLIR